MSAAEVQSVGGDGGDSEEGGAEDARRLGTFGGVFLGLTGAHWREILVMNGLACMKSGDRMPRVAVARGSSRG